MSEQPLRFTSDRRAGRGDSTGSDGGRTSASRPASSASSPKVEAELAAIFGEDEILRRPPDPFEEKILTGRNSFDDLRDQLAQDDEPRDADRPRPGSSGRGGRAPVDSSVPVTPVDGRSERASTGLPRPRPAVREPATSATDSVEPSRPASSRPASSAPSDPQSRVAELRRDLAAHSAARQAAVATGGTPAPSSRFFHEGPSSSRSSARTSGDGAPVPRPASLGRERPGAGTTTSGRTGEAGATGRSSNVEDRIAALRRDLASRRAGLAGDAASTSTTSTPPTRPEPGVRPGATRPSGAPATRPTRPTAPSPATSEEPTPPHRRPGVQLSQQPPVETPQPVTRPGSRPRPGSHETVPVERPVTHDHEREQRAPHPVAPEPIMDEAVSLEVEESLFVPVQEKTPEAPATPEVVAPGPDMLPPTMPDHRPLVEPEPSRQPQSSTPVVGEAKPRPAGRPGRSERTERTSPSVTQAAPRQPGAAYSPSNADTVVVQQLIKNYGSGASQVQALRDVSLGIRRGGLTVVVGPSGAGKSTLLRCMAGLESPTAGSVTVAGRAIGGLNAKQLAAYRREMVGLIFPSHNLLPSLSVQENIVLPFDFNDQALDDSWYDRVASTLQVTDLVQLRPDDLTRLQQLRVACARAVVTRPEIIFADEPTRELDSAASMELTRVLRLCADALNQTVVVATHDPVVAASADRAIVLADGQVAQQFDSPTVDTVAAALRLVSMGRTAA